MTIQNFGICGANSAQILDVEIPKVESFKPTLSIVLAGTNDAGNIDALLPPAAFRANYREILARLNKIKSRIIAMTLPPMINREFREVFGESHFGGYMPNERAISENVIIKEEAARAGATLLDLYAIFAASDLDAKEGYIRQRRSCNGEKDGCHPTATGYSVIAERLYSTIRAISADTSRIACIGDSITYGAYMDGHGTADRRAATYPGILNLFLNPEIAVARKPSPALNGAIIYQISLRAFTKEGTIQAAEKRLSEIKELTSANIVYPIPFVEADTDNRQEFWSSRQLASQCENPRNPYRMADYYKIDPEYGTDADFASFVKTAHSLGLKVMLDLVFFHAGPTFAKRHPAFVQRNADGSIVNGSWSFPQLDYSNPELREHLWENMEYFIREFDVDGYRCDVGDRVPIDFWEEGRRRIEALKPDVFMLCESENSRPEDQRFAFDLNYSFSLGMIMHVLTGDIGCNDFETMMHKNDCLALTGARFVRAYDNHDIANDMYDRRHERCWGESVVDAYLTFCYTIGGVPFLYNGCEFCDANRHSIFSNKGQYVIDRSGEHLSRQTLLRELASLYRGNSAIYSGTRSFVLTNYPRNVIAYVREADDGRRVLVLVNFSTRNIRVKPEVSFDNAAPLLMRCAQLAEDGVELNSYGFAVLELQFKK